MVTRRDKANAIRALAMDAVENAQSGHPGMPMGMADVAEVLWSDFLKHNPNNPGWFDRDRFVLSNGHGSMLQYALLHLTGYDLSIDDLKQFRQLHSRTPGHPEYGMTPGVETTTGPLGQGLGNAVGMALAEKKLAAEFNRQNYPIVDHYTYVFTGDGDMMEGVSHEVSALAATLGLGKLIALWDNNHISIDGEVKDWFTEDVAARYRAYGWHVIENVDAFDADSIKQALTQARHELERPSLICCDSVIGYGAPTKAGTKEAHGAPLGREEIDKAKAGLGWQHGPFEIPDEIYQAWNHQQVGQKYDQRWQDLFKQYHDNWPELAKAFKRRMSEALPSGWNEIAQRMLEQAAEQSKSLATRKSSLQCLNILADELPELTGGSADLSGSNCTKWDNAELITADRPHGQYIYYGVREFGMFTIMNGMALHRGVIPFGGTFLTFIDYGRNALRLSALMNKRAVYVLTHDSIGLGEDGPTHQPVEHAALLRATPNNEVWRPCDHLETAVAWQQAIERDDGPSCLLLSRQKLSQQDHSRHKTADIASGGYVLIDAGEPSDALLIATGSEVGLAVQAAEELSETGYRIRVVSMPCMERFMKQDETYRRRVIPPDVTARVIIEAGSTQPWYRFAGQNGRILGLDDFGESAPAENTFHALGFTVENVTQTVYDVIKNS